MAGETRTKALEVGNALVMAGLVPAIHVFYIPPSFRFEVRRCC
jgi:hypothetical protein